MHTFMTILVAVLVYFLPALVAVYRKHLNAASIVLTDLLLGWTVLGWIVALIWAFTNNPATMATAPAVARKPAKFLKVILVIAMAFILLVALALATHKRTGHDDMMRPPPAVKTGVPVPADEIFGK